MGGTKEKIVDRRYQTLREWETTNPVEQLIVKDDSGIGFWTVLIVLLLLVMVGTLFLTISFAIIGRLYHFITTLDFEALGLVLILSIFWFFCYYLLSGILMAIYESRAITGFYVSNREFIQVLAFKSHIKQKSRPIDQVVTIEAFEHPDDGNIVVQAVFCADQRKRQAGWRTVLDNSLSVNKKRYEYFPKGKGIDVDFIWAETLLDQTEEFTKEKLFEVARHGKELLAKMTNIDKSFYHPELHCTKCGNLSEYRASICGNCGKEIDHSLPKLFIIRAD